MLRMVFDLYSDLIWGESEQFPNPIETSNKEAKSIHLTHKYMSGHFPGLTQSLL
jgi:hypothetical protein